jgi:ubiquinone/menaquinone biosynthesis C-methylase UbiE
MPNKKQITHEEGVEKFYSVGSKIRAHEADGFLSFGYWHKKTKEYYESAENLVKFFLEKGKISQPDTVLDVACGYGAESFRFYNAIKPNKMHCVDITAPHIEFARKRAEEKNLQDKLIFEKRDACRTEFPDESFTHILGIEGPAHFNTRMDFFKESYRVLKKKGELLLTDITFDRAKSYKNFLLKRLSSFASKRWHMPSENWVNAQEYVKQLKEVGFRVETFLTIGDRVYPGFASYNTKFSSIINAIKTRGLFIGIGITIISWFLGYGYRNGVLDYVFVKAVKE